MRLGLGKLANLQWVDPQKARGKYNGEATRLEIIYGFILTFPRCVCLLLACDTTPSRSQGDADGVFW